uniref:VWFA domain-containing protein n=1 Tax=Mola mola TaxID=94237 RepID=A0A3Q3VMR9_MOLML
MTLTYLFSIPHNSAAGFGYQVVQRQTTRLRSDLALAPFAQYSTRGRGQIFSCSTTSCRQLSVALPDFAVNASLGLTMTVDPNTQNTLACAPTIPKDCVSITMYSGVCVQIDTANRLGNPVPSSPDECHMKADIAFLLDGSGSVNTKDFSTMKTFVKNLIGSLKGEGTKFSISQFSSIFTSHFLFDEFDSENWKLQVESINQLRGGTRTAFAIQQVVNEVFLPGRGSRQNVKKVLIVITDGQSTDGSGLPNAAQAAQAKGIIRFAVGVGNAFHDLAAIKELRIIASSPPANHVFQVKNFDTLEIIKRSLQEKIFSIEGSQTSGESLEMEMSQMGFSAAYAPGGIQMGIVGANQWKGGFKKFTSTGKERISYEPTTNIMEPDSYLGYSMVVASTRQGPLTIVGAPRYQHRGVVMAVQLNGDHKKIHPYPEQVCIGQYFGAELCAIDVDRDKFTDLILISAPMYVDSDREGRVYICSISVLNVDCGLENPLMLRGTMSEQGRFGSSLAVLPDLNRDGFNDLAIGAPLENNGQGSIYIFHGESRRRISPTYSQRIAGSEVMSGLRFFGISISHTSFDLSRDNLPDLAVGSKGRVVLLRSKPIVMVEATVSYSQNVISTQTSSCSESLKNTAQVCFTMTKHSNVDKARARINFNLTLDSTRKVPSNRAFISGKKQNLETRSTELDLQKQKCVDINFLVEACPEDALNPILNELKFTFDGFPSDKNLSPSLALQAQLTSIHPLRFEINCGNDDKCVDNLKVDFNFTRSSKVNVGIDELLNVTVSVENSEENSYNSYVILTYPVGLSYRKVTILQGRIQCSSLDSEDGLMRGKTTCIIDNPIFKSNTKVFFIISYGIATDIQLDRRIFITANATSGNQEHSSLSKPYNIKWIDVKYSIFVSIESSHSYNNFTFGKDNLQKPVQQSIVVTNDIRALNFTLVIKVPVKLGDKSIWADSSNLQFPDCQQDNDEEPTVADFVAQIQKNNRVDCSVAKCRVFKCRRLMGRQESKTYSISSNLTSGWIQQIGLKSAKFLLTSTASLEYDMDQYIFISTGSSNNPPIHKIAAEVEVYPEPNFTKEIIGGSLGGLALLSLITVVLYKAGFFKSKYKEMINDGGTEDPGVVEAEPTPAQ